MGWGGVWGVRVGNGTTAAVTKRLLTDTDNQSVRSSFVRSSVCAFVVVRSFVRSFVRAFVCLFVCSVVWSCGCLVVWLLVRSWSQVGVSWLAALVAYAYLLDT